MRTQPVAVVTGGGDARVLATARLLARDHHVVLTDTRREHLHRALDRLDSAGVSAESIVADPADRDSVDVLMAAARQAGPVAMVVHTAGHCGPSPADIVRAHVLGTVHITAATLSVAAVGTTLIHAAPDMARPAHAAPRWLFRLASTHPESLVRALSRLTELGPVRSAPATAHALGGAFVDWYSGHVTELFHARGARVRSGTLVLDSGPEPVVSRAS